MIKREKVIRDLRYLKSFGRVSNNPQITEIAENAIAMLKEQDAQDATDIRDIDGLWCDDITFCPELCNWESCPRNQQNIRDRSVPHSFSVGIPEDCPKWKEGR